jgi:homoserine O-acetyltransferase
MLLPTSKIFTCADFPLSSGERLEELAIAYETWGELDEEGSNAILLCHGYTNHPHAGGDEDGWFHNLMGPGKAVDTDRYFVVCSNMLGSSFGTTGPGMVNPATGKLFGPEFPHYTTADMVEVQRKLIDWLGIGQLQSVIGYSYGGHLAYLWSGTYPDRMRSVVTIAGRMRRTTTMKDIHEIRDWFEERCSGWNAGSYYGREKSGGIHDALIEYRIERLKKYGVGDWLDATVPDPAERDRILRERAETWAGQFDANSLWLLYRAGIGSDARPLAENMRAPLLKVLADTDSVAPFEEGQETVDFLRSHGVDARFLPLHTPYGHAGPMLEAGKWSADLASFLSETS